MTYRCCCPSTIGRYYTYYGTDALGRCDRGKVLSVAGPLVFGIITSAYNENVDLNDRLVVGS